MQKPLVSGIRIVYTENDNGINAVFYAGTGSPKSETFFTRPHIRQIIEKLGISIGTRIGSMKIHVKGNVAVWGSYHPYTPNTGKEELISGFLKSGLAVEQEKRVLKRLKRKFPRITAIIHSDPQISGRPSYSREQQLSKRGITMRDIFEGYPFRRSIRRLNAQIRQDKKTAAARQKRPK